MFYFRYRGRCDHLFQWKYSAKAFIIIYYIYIVDIVEFFGLLAHLFQTFGHTPVFVDGYHFRTHQTTGSIFIILQQVDNVSCLLDVFNVRKYFFLFILIQFTHQVYCVVRIHIVNEAFGNSF